MSKLKDKKVLITGGASGIGFCAAKEFAKAKCELIITDINKDLLEEAKHELSKYDTIVHTYEIDVSNRKKVEEMIKWVEGDLGGIDILINNAGVGCSGELVETGLDVWKKLIDVNLWGPLYHIYGFLPYMIKRKSGQIVNVSSGQAFFRLPTWGAYACVKLALGAFSEILRFELKKLNIKVTTIYPFMVNTGFYEDIDCKTFAQRLSMKLVPYYSQKPETVGKIIFKAVKKKKSVEKVNILNDVAYYTRFLTPVSNLINSAAIFLLGKDKKILQDEIITKYNLK